MTDEGAEWTPEKALGGRIRQSREGRGWTQRELAAQLSAVGWRLDATAITRLEQGERAVQLRQVYILAEVFGVRPHTLIQDVHTLHERFADAETALIKARYALVDVAFRADRVRLALEEGDRADGVPSDLASAVNALCRNIAETVEGSFFEIMAQDAEAGASRKAAYDRLILEVARDVVAFPERAEP